MDDFFGYITFMDKDVATPTPDRIRAGKALAEAIDKALEKKLVSNYVEIGDAMGFNRTNIAHHKKGTRPMSRDVVLRYAEVLQCEPDQIADDNVRMELARDLQRYENDLASYAVIKEYSPSDRTPIKLPRDLLEMEGIPPSELSTMRLQADGNGKGNAPDHVVIVWSNSRKPVNSGKMHVMVKNGAGFIAKIVEDGNGYIITPENKLGEHQPTFRTREEMIRDGVVVAGQVYWRLSKE